MLKKLFYMFLGILAFIGACVIIVVLQVSTWISAADFDMGVANRPEIADNSVLRIDFSAEIPEGYQNGFSWTALQKSVYYPPFIKVISAVKAAKNDSRIVGIYAKLADNTLNAAQSEEFRKVITDFRKSGKKAIVYATSVNPGLNDYYLASAFDEVWMSPHSLLPIIGVSAKFPFFKKLLTKLGINPVVFAKYEYKGFMSSFTDETLSAPIKENMKNLLGDTFDTMLDGIASSRNIAKDRLKTFIDGAPLLAEEAKTLGLVDKVLYRSEVDHEASVIFSSGKEIEVVDLPAYSDSLSDVSLNRGKIAYLVLSGEIKAPSAVVDFAENSLNDESVMEQLQKIEKMEDLKAVVLRVDSPGGAYDIADSIRFELLRLKKYKKIPVIASFGGTAASGGYFFSTVADYIFADKLTVTGSIGAVSMMFDVSEGLKKLDIGMDTLKYGANADIFDFTVPSSILKQKSFDRMTTAVYNDFIEKVSFSRKIPLAQMNNVARGRVFSGSAALKNHLVDENGGIFEAVEYAEKKEGGKLDVVIFPEPKAPWEILKDKILAGDIGGLLNLNKVFFNFFSGMSNAKLMMKEQKIEIN